MFSRYKMSTVLNLKKELWATQTWEMLHSFAAAANTKTKRENFKKIWEGIRDGGLPCEEICTPHFRELCRELNIDDFMTDNQTLLHLTFLAHNSVNKRLGKPEADWIEVRDKYLGKDARCDDCRSPESKKVGAKRLTYINYKKPIFS